jgi:peroxiredoxin
MPTPYGGQSQQRWNSDTLNKHNVMQDMVLADLQGELRLTALARKSGMLVLAFFHTDCTTSALMLPYLQKLANAYKETGKLIVWGVSQDDSATTSAFVQQHGIAFPVCLDRESYHSTLLGVVTVPTVFLVNGAGEVVRKIVGWDRRALNQMSADIAAFVEQATPAVIVPDDDSAPARRFGCGTRRATMLTG